jgi:hypothetical protein
MKKKQAKMAAVVETPTACFRCGSDDIIQIAAKCNDLCRVTRGGKTEWGYVPEGIGLGEDPNYVEFTYCRMCGQIQTPKSKA